MKLDDIVPWGRSLAEYRRMFDLDEGDLDKQILGCGDGPASFNAEMTALGKNVVSIDPIYRFNGSQIDRRVRDTYSSIISQVDLNRDRYVWDYFPDADALGEYRLETMEKFLADYETGKAAGRYLDRSLPDLEMNDYRFDLCLCSHLLFLYSDHLSLEFHRRSIHELLKISHEVRIFPLLTLDCQPSPYLESIVAELTTENESTRFTVEVKTVNYEFQKGGNKLLSIVRK
jgi:hypothetical protein